MGVAVGTELRVADVQLAALAILGDGRRALKDVIRLAVRLMRMDTDTTFFLY